MPPWRPCATSSECRRPYGGGVSALMADSGVQEARERVEAVETGLDLELRGRLKSFQDRWGGD
ncbi:hypothetical protein [Streptomyces sp. NPDC013740]|uniref:hypothetical protein n=1 Tax=Streptomyces sp. NPDC013740 TaxID=3364867 RepID=UPI0036FF50B2